MLSPNRTGVRHHLLLWALVILAILGIVTAAQAASDSSDLPPTAVRVAILNASGVAVRGTQLALVLGEYRRRELEGLIGLKLELVNVSSTERKQLPESQVNYRPGFLRAALVIARAMPGDQRVRLMSGSSLKRLGIDIEILLGKEAP